MPARRQGGPVRPCHRWDGSLGRGAAALSVRRPARFIRDVADTRATRKLLSGDHTRILEHACPAARFTESAQDIAHRYQWVRVENSRNPYGDPPEPCDRGLLRRRRRLKIATSALAASTDGWGIAVRTRKRENPGRGRGSSRKCPRGDLNPHAR